MRAPIPHLAAIVALGLGLAGAEARVRDLPAGEAERTSSLAGRLLVAAPGMPDPRFAETVIVMVAHDQGGAMGLIVNRPEAEVPIASLLEAAGRPAEGVEGSILLHYGGPVGTELGFVLHSSDHLEPGSRQIAPGLALTTDVSILAAIGQGSGPERHRFAFGYAGWAPGQLEGELAEGAWIVLSLDLDLVFDDDYASKWRRAIERHGIETRAPGRSAAR